MVKERKRKFGVVYRDNHSLKYGWYYEKDEEEDDIGKCKYLREILERCDAYLQERER